MKILLIMIPAPIVGYFVLDSVRQIFSEDRELLKNLIREQPVTALAAMTAVGSIVVWGVVVVAVRVLGPG